jgi:hypothetical protein
MFSYITFRKIHRLLVLVISVATLLMAFTGLLLKYPRITNILPFDLVTIRNLHNVASPFFTIILVLMMISGLVMYFYPIWRNHNK